VVRPPESSSAGSEPPAALGEAAYAELRALAAAHLRRERRGHTLQPTALAHEAWLRLGPALASGASGGLQAAASRVLREILVDHARRRAAAKRGGAWRRVTLDPSACRLAERPLDLLALDEALERLARLDERQARVVELRFFGGLETAEVARVLGVSTRTVEGDWTMARAFLRRELEERDGA
jgi:RNA polymerase sigma-70 factor (ECF subfamily)